MQSLKSTSIISQLDWLGVLSNLYNSKVRTRGMEKEGSLTEQSIEDSPQPMSYDTRPLNNNKAELAESPEKSGLANRSAQVFLVLWYIFSTLTLFLNKYIVDYQNGDSLLLGVAQMFMCTLGGGVHLFYPCGLYNLNKKQTRPSNFYKNMLFVGVCRFATVLFGLKALIYIVVSFAETVKSSAPIFTVVITKLFLGEGTSIPVLCSLIPIMLGLALTSAYELSFNIYGLIYALLNNITECVCNVYSKKLVSHSDYVYSPAEMQFYSSIGAYVVVLPAMALMVNHAVVWENMTWTMFWSLILNGICYHGQTICEYGLMQYIAPVTHSVANTVKRALMIWLSVIVFGNKITGLAAFGMILVTAGVFIYNKAREKETLLKQQIIDKC